MSLDLSTTVGKATAATGAVLGVFGVYMIARGTSSKKAIKKEKLLKIFKRITADMHSVIMTIAQQEKQIRTRAAQGGQKVSNAEILQFVQQQFAESMAKKEAQAYQDNKVTESMVKKAAKKFKGDAEFEKVVDQMRTYAAMINPTKEELPASFTEDKMIMFMSEMLEVLNVCVEQTAAQLKANGIAPGTRPFQAQISMKMQAQMQVINVEMPKKHGITQGMVQLAMEKFQSSPKFMREMAAMTEEQKQRFEACGVES